MPHILDGESSLSVSNEHEAYAHVIVQLQEFIALNFYQYYYILCGITVELPSLASCDFPRFFVNKGNIKAMYYFILTFLQMIRIINVPSIKKGSLLAFHMSK
jgi:hypothetical protein